MEKNIEQRIERLIYMNEHTIKGKWAQIKGSIKEQWGDLTDDELLEVEGQTEKLAGLLQSKYGYSKEKAEKAYKKVMENAK